MKKYIKDGVVINEGTPITDGDLVHYYPTAQMYADAGWAEYFEPIPERTLADAKTEMIAKITGYDNSSSVNGFLLNGNTIWFDKADRVGLMNSTQILKDSGQTSCTLWYNGTPYTIPCDTLINMLSQVEIYALECYNVTARHKAEVNALTEIASVDAYDYTEGYPSQLSFNV